MTAKEHIINELQLFNIQYLTNVLVEKPEYNEVFWDLIFNGTGVIPWRSAYVIDKHSEKYPSSIQKYIPIMIEKLPALKEDGLKRHFLRMLQRATLPEETLGLLIDVCFRWLSSPGEAIAVRVHAMQIIYDVSQDFPDLKPELVLTLESIIGISNPGIISRASKLLFALRKEMNPTEHK